MGVRSSVLPVCTFFLLVLSLTLWTGQFSGKDTSTSDSTATKQEQYVPRYEEVLPLKNNLSKYLNNSVSCAIAPVKCLLLAAKIIFKYSNVTMAQSSLEDNTTGNIIIKLMNSSQYIRTAKRLTLLGIYISYEVFKVVMYSSVSSILVATVSLSAIRGIALSQNIQQSSEFRHDSTTIAGILQSLKLKIVNTVHYLIESALSWLFYLIAMVNKLICLCCPFIVVVAILMLMGGTVEAGYSGTLQTRDTKDSCEFVNSEEILQSPVNIQNDEHQEELQTREYLSLENIEAHSRKSLSEKLQGSPLKHYCLQSLFGKICKINDRNSIAEVHTDQSVQDTSKHFAVLNQFLSKPQQAFHDILELMMSSIPEDIPPIDQLLSWQISPLLNFCLFLIMACCHLYVIRHTNYFAFNVNGPVASVQEDNVALLPNLSSNITSNHMYQYISYEHSHSYDYLSNQASIPFIQPVQCSNVVNDMSKMAQVLPDRKLVRESRVGPLNSEMVLPEALSKPVGVVPFEGQRWEFVQNTNDFISLPSNEEEMLQGIPILFDGQPILGFSSHLKY